MRWLSIWIFLIFLLIGCKKTNLPDKDPSDLEGWTRKDFKAEYSIQVPQGFVGGVSGFEGNTFYMTSFDKKIKLGYWFCTSLFCYDFGDSLKKPIPGNIRITNNYSKLITLDQIEYFHKNTDTLGILYFSTKDTADGRLYWKDNGAYKEAMQVEFTKDKLDTVVKIIGTIKRKSNYCYISKF